MTTQEILNSLKTSDFLQHSNIPLGYTPGLPIPAMRGKSSCLVVPMLKYKITGEVDHTMVFPPRFVVTATADKAAVVAFEDLKYDNRFKLIDFDSPVGVFRHAEIRHLTKQEYEEARAELYGVIDMKLKALDGGCDFDEMDTMKFSRLYSMLLEPAVKPFYKAIDKDFVAAYVQ